MVAMRKNKFGLLGFALTMILITTLALAAMNKSQDTEQMANSIENKARMRHKTFAPDNTRFFTNHSLGGKEDWFKITTKGKREWLTGIDARRSALVIVDMQPGCLGWSKLPGELGKAHKNRTANLVIPNLVKLVDVFRKKGLIIVYLTLGVAQPIPEIALSVERAKQKLEFLVPKYSSGAFATSAMDNVLRENGIGTLFFVGTDTAGCVDATMHEAYDRSYQTILIEDACMSARQELHEAAVLIWAYKGYVRTTDQVITDYPWLSWIDPEVIDPNDPMSER